MDDILEMSRNDTIGRPPPSRPQTSTQGQYYASEPSYVVKSRIQARIGALDSEMASIDQDIAQLVRVKSDLAKEKRALQSELDAVGSTKSKAEASTSTFANISAAVSSNTIDYNEEFEWSGPMKGRMKDVFGISNFRLCQEG